MPEKQSPSPNVALVKAFAWRFQISSHFREVEDIIDQLQNELTNEMNLRVAGDQKIAQLEKELVELKKNLSRP
jgi:hypothetical protein